MKKPNLRDFTQNDIASWMAERGEPRFRADQVFQWVHGKQAQDWNLMTNVQRQLRDRLQQEVSLDGLAEDRMQVSQDGTRKYRLRTHDDRLIESVLIPDADARTIAEEDDDSEDSKRMTLCVSSQVGCALDCQFCATAKLGFGRHLTAGEIVSQIYWADQVLAGLPSHDPTRLAGGDRLTNLVFMGMGEPLHNYNNLVKALSILTHPKGRNFPRRRITVSTAGLVPAIERFAQEPVRVNLAVSLNATTDAQRDQIMPINRTYNLDRLLGVLRTYPLDRKQNITFEYVLLGGFNDTIEDARRFPSLLKGIHCKINLIPWNPNAQSPYDRPARETVLAFQRELMRLGFSVYIRKTKGADIDAACGQLAAASATGKNRLPIVSS